MAVSEEYLAVSDLTALSEPTADDQLVLQSAGANGDVMLLAISSLITLLQNTFAQLESPEFKGVPTVPDIRDITSSDTQIANTAFVQAVAEKKANISNPEFSGTANFPEAIPTTIDGDGNLVKMATKTDISALNESIESMTESINALSSAITSLIMVRVAYEEDNKTIGKNGEYARGGIDISVQGYTPVAVAGFGIYGASSGGANSTWCIPARFMLWNNSLEFYIWNQNTTSAAKVKIIIKVLYVKAPSEE